MAWAAIGYNYKSPLYLFHMKVRENGLQHRSTSRSFKGHLKSFLSNRETSVVSRTIVEYTGSQIQEGIKVLYNAVRIECHINSIDWPPGSPDLNPIENMRKVLKQKLQNRKPHWGWTLSNLQEAMVDIWNNEITIDLIDKYIDPTPQRIRMVRLRKGGLSG